MKLRNFINIAIIITLLGTHTYPLYSIRLRDILEIISTLTNVFLHNLSPCKLDLPSNFINVNNNYLTFSTDCNKYIEIFALFTRVRL